MVLLRIIMVSAVLLGFYFLFLEKEKMFRFNRFYLLTALVFSYAVPWMVVTLPAADHTAALLVAEPSVSQMVGLTSEKKAWNWDQAGLWIYISVTLCFLGNFLVSLLKIINLKGCDHNIHSFKIRILDRSHTAFSFWNTMYISADYMRDKQIEKRIFLHEKAHLRQKHSLDLIFIQLLMVFSWFNPLLWGYRKAMVNNHEFLADEEVLQSETDIRSYCNLILHESMLQQRFPLVNSFNFNSTKKRFSMMNTQKTKMTNLKKVMTFPLFVGLAVWSVQKIHATVPSAVITDEKYQKIQKEFSVNVSSGINLQENGQQDVYAEKVTTDTIKKKKTVEEVAKAEPEENKNPLEPLPNPYDIAAEFPGGMGALRKKFAEVFNVSQLNGKGTLKTFISFRISQDGIVDHFKAEGTDAAFNAEAEKAIIAANGNTVWKPAEKDGKPVSAVFKFPVVMNFQ